MGETAEVVASQLWPFWFNEMCTHVTTNGCYWNVIWDCGLNLRYWTHI